MGNRFGQAEIDLVTGRFLELYDDLRDQTFTSTQWLGERVMKAPTDLFILQEIVVETRPDVVIESGVLTGGSALFYASVLDLLGERGRVVGIDVDLSHVPRRVRRHPRVELIEGSSTDPEVLSRLRTATAGGRVMVDLDSDHDADHVLDELRTLSQLVTPGCYLVVEDTVIGGRPILPEEGPGPRDALDGWLAEGQPFEVDHWRERLLLTTNHGGYLRRVDDEAAGGGMGSDGVAPCVIPTWRRDEGSARAAAPGATSADAGAEALRRRAEELEAAERRLRARIASDSFRHAAQVAVLSERLESQRQPAAWLRHLADRWRRRRRRADQPSV